MNFRAVLISFMKFAVVGVCNTALDAVMFWALVEMTGLSHPVSRVISFMAANVFSYYANSLWSFNSSVSKSKYARFLITSLVGAGLAYLITLLGDTLGWHYMISFLVSSAVLPPLNFAMMKIFVFSEKGATPVSA